MSPNSAPLSKNRAETSILHRARLHHLLHVVFPLLLCQRFAGLLVLAVTARRPLVGLIQPQEDWITPSIGVSCQMVSCTCCLEPGWARHRRPGPCWSTWLLPLRWLLYLLMPIRTTDDCFAHIQALLAQLPLSSPPPPRAGCLTYWWGNGRSQPTFDPSNQQLRCQKWPVAISCSNISLPRNCNSIQWVQWEPV